MKILQYLAIVALITYGSASFSATEALKEIAALRQQYDAARALMNTGSTEEAFDIATTIQTNAANLKSTLNLSETERVEIATIEEKTNRLINMLSAQFSSYSEF